MARLREIREARGEGAVGVPRDARVVGAEISFDAPDED
jgi:hypothetical protein